MKEFTKKQTLYLAINRFLCSYKTRQSLAASYSCKQCPLCWICDSPILNKNINNGLEKILKELE